MSVLPNDTPKEILRRAHKKKMLGKHMRNLETGRTRMSIGVAGFNNRCAWFPSRAKELRSAAYENVSQRVRDERAKARKK